MNQSGDITVVRLIHSPPLAVTCDHSPKSVSFVRPLSFLFNRFRLEPDLLRFISGEVGRLAFAAESTALVEGPGGSPWLDGTQITQNDTEHYQT